MNNQDFSLFDNLIEGIQVISPDFKYVYINDALANQIKFSKSDLIGNRILENFPNLKDSTLLLQVKHCMNHRENVESARKFRLMDGSIKWLEFKMQPIEEGILIMSSDITEKKKIALALEEKEKWYRLIFKKMHEAFMVQEVLLDDNGELRDLRLLDLNLQGAKGLGKKSPEELIGKLRTEYLGPLDEEITAIVRKVVFEKKTLTFEKYYSKIDRWLLMHLYSPQPNQIASLVIDISKRKEYEKKMEELNQLLEFMVNDRTSELVEALEREKKLSKVKSSFLSIAAHELKTPLAAIKLIVNLLEKMNKGAETEGRRKYHGYIRDEADSLLQLLDRFISPSHQEIGGSQLNYLSFNIAVFLEKIIAEFQEMCKEDQTIQNHFQGEKIVRLDKGIFRRIVTNLLSNAIKYSEQDIVLTSTVKEEKLVLEVIDKGIGIPEGDHEKMFTPYFRAKNISHLQGTGLGLNITKIYVELMKGTIDFKSEENKGTTFTVELPC